MILKTGVSRATVAETQTTSHIVDSCLSTKLDGVLSRLHSADGGVVQWLANLER